MLSQAIYRERAELYDLIYRRKDYEREVRILREILRAHGIADGCSIVESACGTGSYLELLLGWYDVSGFDINQGVLEVAKRKLPSAHLFTADLRTFTLPTPADAILCLFSSIGYLLTHADLSRAATAFYTNLRPGGIAVIEPWLSPTVFRTGFASVDTYDGEEVKLARAVVSKQQGDRSIYDFHWLVATPEGDVEHFVERHELLLCPTEHILDVFRGAGFDVEWLPEALEPLRGLVVATRPA